MVKITFMGAGSTVFARNVLGDCMCTPALCDAEIALYDIDGDRLNDSYVILSAINKNVNEGRASIHTYLGVPNRKDALRDANFVVNAIQSAATIPVPSQISRFRKNTVWIRPSPTHWESAESCGRCAPSLCWKISHATWRKSALTLTS